MVKVNHPLKPIFTFLLLLVITACSTKTPNRLVFSMPALAPGDATQQMWPPPPNVPRYLYIGDLRGESNKIKDSKEKRSAMSRFFSALVGLGHKSIPLVDLLRPQQGVADDKGHIYVTDPGRNAVFVFDETTSEFNIWNENEFSLPFKSPIGVAISGDNVLVTDSELGVVFVIDDQGKLLDYIGQDILKRPTGIAFDSSRQQILVSDTQDNNIKVFSLQGEFIDVIGSPGTKPGQFNRPTFIQFSNNHLYVTDSINARIQIINRETNDVKIIGQRGLYVGDFSRPKGLAVDSDGNMYITESYYDHLLIFNPEGKLLLAIGGSGQQPGEFLQPTGVWVDHNDRLFVSDMLNSRVSIFQYLGGG